MALVICICGESTDTEESTWCECGLRVDSQTQWFPMPWQEPTIPSFDPTNPLTHSEDCRCNYCN